MDGESLLGTGGISSLPITSRSAASGCVEAAIFSSLAKLLVKFLAAFRVMSAGAVILANAVVIGLETDEKEEDWPQTQEMIYSFK